MSFRGRSDPRDRDYGVRRNTGFPEPRPSANPAYGEFGCNGRYADGVVMNNTSNFVQLYSKDEDDCWTHSMTPRLAYLFAHTAIVFGDMVRDSTDIWADCFPPVCQPYLQRENWLSKFVQCLNRIATRIVKGMGPAPNCTGEEFALYLIMQQAKDTSSDDVYPCDSAPYTSLPSHGDDDKEFYDAYSNNCEDEDVLMLFQNPRAVLGAIGESMGVANIHPSEWFIMFKPELGENHLISTEV